MSAIPELTVHLQVGIRRVSEAFERAIADLRRIFRQREAIRQAQRAHLRAIKTTYHRRHR